MPEGTSATGGSERGGRRRRVAATVLGAGLGVLALAAAFIRVPYVIISPGTATPLDDQVVRVDGAQTYDHAGELLFLTVRVNDEDPNLYRWLFAQLDGDTSVQPREALIGCSSYGASARLDRILMRDSQDVAKAVALRALGYDPIEEGTEAVVLDVLCDGPSEGRLETGDLIRAVDDSPVGDAGDVGRLVTARDPGDTVVVTVRRDEVDTDVRVRLGEREGRALLGIVTQTITRFTFPFEIRIDTRRVSGPSAGLSFALAIIDDLTPGELTGGARVAVTGSINPDGTVGLVGGIAQKAVAARAGGATLMLVPAGEAREARPHADGMRVVAVRTLDDALRELRRSGGDPLGDNGATELQGV